MKSLIDFAKTCVVGGFFGIVPVLLLVMVLGESLNLLAAIATPLAEALPVDELGGIETARIVALLLMVLACFLAGVFLRTRVGTWSTEFIEDTVLNRLPGYSLLKTVSHRFGGLQEGSLFAAALADLHGTDARTVVFIVEEHDDGHYTVLVPNAPTPTVGTLYVLPARALTLLDASPGAVANSFMSWGIGSKQLFSSPGTETPTLG
jgi:uncharacterized membrane protein